MKRAVSGRDRDEATVEGVFVVDPPESEVNRPAVFWLREIEVTEGGLRPVYMGHVFVDGQLEQEAVANQLHAKSGMAEFSIRGVRVAACDEEGAERNHGAVGILAFCHLMSIPQGCS